MITALIFITFVVTAITMVLHRKRNNKKLYYTLFAVGVVAIFILVIIIGFLILIDENGQFPAYILP